MKLMHVCRPGDKAVRLPAISELREIGEVTMLICDHCRGDEGVEPVRMILETKQRAEDLFDRHDLCEVCRMKLKAAIEPFGRQKTTCRKKGGQ